jgi:hypothetical protein
LTQSRSNALNALVQWKVEPVGYQPGDRVEYVAEPVFDLIIVTGEVGTVTREEAGWVYAI